MASEKEINQFKDLIDRWIDQDRAKRLIIEARKWTPEPTEWLAQKALREWEEFIGWDFNDWVEEKPFIPEDLWWKLKDSLQEQVLWEWLVSKWIQSAEEAIESFTGWEPWWLDVWVVKTLEAWLRITWWAVNEVFNQAWIAIWETLIKPNLESLDTAALQKIKEVTDVPIDVIKSVLENENVQKWLALAKKWIDLIPEDIQTDIEAALNIFWWGQVKKWSKLITKNLDAIEVPKIKLPSLKNQDIAESLLDTTFKFKPSQKNKFRQPTLGNGKSPSQYLIEKGIIKESSTADDVLKWLTELAKNSKKAVDDWLSGIKETFKHKETNQIIDVLLNETSDVPWLETIVNRLSELKAKWNRWEWLSLSEINEVKRSSDEILNLFSVTGWLKEWAIKKWLWNLRDSTKKFIEKEADKQWFKNVKDLNKDTQLSNELLKIIDSNLEAWRSNRLIWLTDFLVAWTWIAWWDLWIWLWAVALKKLAESERFKIALAKRLSNVPSVKVDEIITKLNKWEILTWIEKVLIWTAIIEAQKDINILP